MATPEPQASELLIPTGREILDRIILAEVLAALPRRKRLGILRRVTAQVGAQAEHRNIVPFGPKTDEAALVIASDEAAELWRHMLAAMVVRAG